MSVKSSFVSVYNCLETYYTCTDRYYDQLGSMLSDMYPSDWLLDDGSSRFDSADPAVYDDWTESWDRIVGKDKEGTPEQVFMVAKTILDYYTNEVEYELGDAESYLKEHLGA